MRVVLDSNVIVAAFASRGLCESILELCLDSHEVVLSEGLLAETRKNLSKKIKLPQAVIEEIMKFLREHSIILSPVFVPEGACRDSDDLEALGLAMASETPVIVTGDQDLLVLNKYEGIRILTPHAFSDMLHNKK